MWTNVVRVLLKKAMVLLLFSACNSRGDSLTTTRFWKYSDGFAIGDVLDFNQANLTSRGDTIFKNDRAMARVLRIENRWITADRVLHIESMHDKKIGRYIAK